MKKLVDQSGQMMLIAVLIVLILLISIPAVVFINSMSTRSSVSSLKNQRSVVVNQEGLSFAMHALTSYTTSWTNSLAASFPPEFKTDQGAVASYAGTSGGLFAIVMGTGNPANMSSSDYQFQPYEVKLIVKGGNPGPNGPVFSRASLVAVSQKTLAATTPTGIQASAAVEFMQTPVGANSKNLVVHWGPVVIFDTNTWTVNTAMDDYQFPRKFGQGDITANGSKKRSQGTNGVNTDNQEYWANTALGFPNAVDVAMYKSSATKELSVPAMTVLSGAFPNKQGASYECGTPLPLSTPCGKVNLKGDYMFASSSSVIYIHGDALFEDILIDLKHCGNNTTCSGDTYSGAIIITGNLTLGDHKHKGLRLNLRVPPTAAAEYPYFPVGNPPNWPCKNNYGQTAYCCSAPDVSNNGGTGLGYGDSTGLGATGTGTNIGNGLVQFRGFLYVMGDLDVTTDGWLLAGVLRVDGKVTIPNAGSKPYLTVLYDDAINHQISVKPLELMIDYQKEVPAS